MVLEAQRAQHQHVLAFLGRLYVALIRGRKRKGDVCMHKDKHEG
jgi:hypothetical protein